MGTFLPRPAETVKWGFTDAAATRRSSRADARLSAKIVSTRRNKGLPAPG